MSEPQSLTYAHGHYFDDVRIFEEGDSTKIIFPRRRSRPLMFALVGGGAGIATVACALTLAFGPPGNTRWLVPLMPLLASLVIVFAISAVASLIGAPRVDELTLTSKGILIEQWCHRVEKDVEIDWSAIVAIELDPPMMRFSEGHYIVFLTEAGPIAIRWNQAIGRVQPVLELLRAWHIQYSNGGVPIVAAKAID